MIKDKLQKIDAELLLKVLISCRELNNSKFAEIKCLALSVPCFKFKKKSQRLNPEQKGYKNSSEKPLSLSTYDELTMKKYNYSFSGNFYLYIYHKNNKNKILNNTISFLYTDN
jgi:hypothetical protein